MYVSFLEITGTVPNTQKISDSRPASVTKHPKTVDAARKFPISKSDKSFIGGFL